MLHVNLTHAPCSKDFSPFLETQMPLLIYLLQMKPEMSQLGSKHIITGAVMSIFIFQVDEEKSFEDDDTWERLQIGSTVCNVYIWI